MCGFVGINKITRKKRNVSKLEKRYILRIICSSFDHPTRSEQWLVNFQTKSYRTLNFAIRVFKFDLDIRTSSYQLHTQTD